MLPMKFLFQSIQKIEIELLIAELYSAFFFIHFNYEIFCFIFITHILLPFFLIFMFYLLFLNTKKSMKKEVRMNKIEFFEGLATYVKKYDVPCTVVNDTFTDERYAAFGKDKVGFPRVFLDKERNIGNIDVYSLEFFNPVNKILFEEQQYYSKIICMYLENFYESQEYGYIIYRRNKVHENRYTNIPDDSFVEEISNNHFFIESESPIYPFLISDTIYWAAYSSNKNVEEYFQSIFQLLNTFTILEKIGIDIEIYDYKFINSINLFNKLMFRYSNIQYIISIIPAKTPEFELRISAFPHYFPLRFVIDDELDIVSLIGKLETLNRLHRLFE